MQRNSSSTGNTIKELQKKIQEDQAAKAAVTKKKDFQQEIAQARSNKSAAEATEQPVAVPAIDDAAAAAERRKANKAALNAKFSNIAPPAPSTSIMRDQELFGNAKHKAQFAKNKLAIAKWSTEMHKKTRQNLASKLNIQRFMIDAQPQAMEAVAVAPASSNLSVKTMQMFPVGHSMLSSDAQSIQAVELAPEQSVTFAEVFNLANLCQASLANVPKGQKVNAEDIFAKLEAFMKLAEKFNDIELAKFVVGQRKYDALLEQLKSVAPFVSVDEKAVLESNFRKNQKDFIEHNNQLLPLMLDAVSHLSDLIAYLQVNADLGIVVRQELATDYEMNGHSESTQMKKALVERCSPDICKKLNIAHDNSENVTEIIFSILRNEALRNNDAAAITRLVK